MSKRKRRLPQSEILQRTLREAEERQSAVHWLSKVYNIPIFQSSIIPDAMGWYWADFVVQASRLLARGRRDACTTSEVNNLFHDEP